MRRLRWPAGRLLLAMLAVGGLAAASCGGEEPTDEPLVCVDTWENWAEGFHRTWCTSCHSSALAEGARYGAPLGVDFDVYATTARYAGAIAARVQSSDPEVRMPPVGGPGEEETQRLRDWVACGAPGEGAPPVAAPCAGGDWATVAGDVVFDPLEDTAPPCDGAGVRVEGSVTVRDVVEIDCLCAIEGDLIVEAGSSVAMPGLVEVGGDVRAEGAAELAALGLGALATVGGSVSLVDLEALDSVRLGWLRSVGGSLVVERLAVADLVDLTRLVTVGGDLRLEGMPRFSAFVGDGGALASVGGDLVLADLDDWLGFFAFDWLQTVGGQIRIGGHDRITQIRGFNTLSEVGSVLVAENPNLRILGGFGSVRSLPGAIEVRDHGIMGRMEAFESLQAVGGLRVAGNDGLQRITGLDELEAVTGALVLDSLPVLEGLPELAVLASVEGSLEVRDVGVGSLAGLEALRTIGALTLVGNPDLVNVQALHELTEVSGDVVVRENRSLAASAVSTLVSEIGTIGGTTDVGDNGE